MLASLWYSERIRSWSAQALLLAAFLGLILWLVGNTVTNLNARGIPVGFAFLGRPANFPISESVIPYSPADTFLWAFVVGLGNTLYISVIAIVLSTALGLVVGLARRSKNPLTAGVTGVYVTAVRNTPLIVQLLFWYAIATTALPSPRDAFNPVEGVFVSIRGVFLPRLDLLGQVGAFLAASTVGFCLLLALYVVTARRGVAKGLRAYHLVPAWVALCVALAFLFGVTASVSVPELRGFNFDGGYRVSPEFAALVIGFVIYTSAYIGEIIRGGIDAVGKGQWEAGRSIGLTERQTLAKVIVPQALRIIIPPLTTQYVSTVKNTTLALAVGFPELGLVVGTVINQTGQAIESILVFMALFLSISLSVSLPMNWYNRRVALVQR